MAFKIERALTPLFGLLKLQSLGNLPRIVNEEVRPTIELGKWALAAAGVRVESRNGLAAVGTVATLTTQADWWLYGVQLSYTGQGTADYVAASVQVLPRGNAGDAYIGAAITRFGSGTFMSTQGLGEVMWNNYTFPYCGGHFLPKGSVINLNCTYTVTAGVMGTLNMNCVAYRIGEGS